MKVGVIIPVRNRVNVIYSALESIARQTYGHLEVVVVDDCSDVPVSISNVNIHGVPVRTYRTRKPVGAACARNIGVSIIQCECIAFLDSDDVWEPTKIAAQVRAIGSYGRDCIVYTSVRVKKRNGDVVCSRSENHSGVASSLLENGWAGPLTSSILMDKDLFVSVGGFDVGMRSMQEVDLYFRLRNIVKFQPIDEYLTIWNESIDGITKNMESFINGRQRFLDKHGSSITRAYRAKIYRSMSNMIRASNRWRSLRYALRAGCEQPLSKRSIASIANSIWA